MCIAGANACAHVYNEILSKTASRRSTVSLYIYMWGSIDCHSLIFSPPPQNKRRHLLCCNCGGGGHRLACAGACRNTIAPLPPTFYLSSNQSYLPKKGYILLQLWYDGSGGNSGGKRISSSASADACTSKKRANWSHSNVLWAAQAVRPGPLNLVNRK
jgi:hypothetical protein